MRPSLETISSIPRHINHQPNCSEVRPLMEQQTTPVTSTPRRPVSDSFDNSDGNRQRMIKRLRMNDLPPRNEQAEQHHLPTLVPPHHHQHSFNVNVLKRAVSIAIMLKKLFADNQIPIKELSMCVQTGERRFKFAVGEKADFLTLFNWIWPEEIDDKKAEIIKLHTLPDCFVLVVRYVPLDINQDTARQQILKTIPAAVGFSPIHYHYRQRPSYDILFTVRSLEQYQTALELGRLSIGQHYLPLTTFLIGYRLTHCTACWKISHMRDKCQSSVSCRWGTRALEVLVLIFKVDSPVCVFNEVGELWNSFKVPHFTSFYQKGTNHSGGAMITIGKHLRATRIDTDIENTVIVDIHGLSGQIRIIGIYWPQGQMRNLNDLSPFLVKGTILTGDFNATSDEWGSQSTDRRGNSLKK
ncbi:unnamed protein product [Rotaria magnacalcarata]|uniref:Endonuclease/exonuclease/phosphatase domain-containing protein n=1 Tax=Rotaria magnacalcarata TaxID=392030 RepID=A0A815JV76_9BILA|nr:unnamed protein product [Rotaria magnacalcarata]CAF1681144.1 unnamed protein product [Rotaria magnacalcarata]CAF3847824.1 unnamed protein product [Rotaria magnacalcarata]CAF3848976.1 unnamed protein product [Rotaria magnacalcarata]CAF3857726.1 unnamed protein product [Rotaria magnacalcarata]